MAEYEDPIDDLPSWIREDPDVRAVIRCQALESQRIRTRLEELRDQFIPMRSGELGLPFWEALLQAADPTGRTVEERREEVRSRLAAAAPDSRGLRWQEQVTGIIGSGWTYEEDHENYVLSISVPFPPPVAWIEPLIRPFTPAHLDLVISSDEGFFLDASELDEEQFHGS